MSIVFNKFFSQALASSAPSADLRRITLEADPLSDRATALRLIAQDLLSAAQSSKSLVLIPAQSGNASWLVANLAYALAETQNAICLVDANFRRPRLAEIFGLSLTVSGLANVLGNTSSINAVEYQINPYLTIIPGGTVGGDIVKLVSTPKLSEIINELSSKYSLTLVVTPPSSDVLDYTFISRACEGAVFVVQRDKCKMTDLVRAQEQLVRINIPLVYALLSNK